MTFNAAPAVYKAPKTVSITLPNNVGTLTIQPFNAERLKVTSPTILSEPNLYRFSAFMQKHGEAWFFYNKPEFGDTGSRPSPKKAEALALLIVKAVNGAFASDVNFQRQMADLEQQAIVEAAERERKNLQHERRRLERTAQDAAVRLGYAQRDISDRQAYLEEAHKELAAFDVEHPEVQSWTD